MIVAEGSDVTEPSKNTIQGFVDVDARALTSPERHDAPRPYLSDLAVSSDRRRQGVGQGLVRFCESLCLNSGHDRLYLKMQRPNYMASRMYAKLGYSSEVEYEDGKVLMSKCLEHANGTEK
mmetsp:Transcript_49431/g.67358  ORF Transcript_49431/g.67358 Transcript_49431/m.67358 type:complete len:121 (-) Transcript_49431:147-509(-)|eukprot:CAMPEP_0185753720 /NCGR_PEP_ID=MMETSP1174-20130828/12439_1 /TAXON_ID=35687 /ORGANISM="Dictyocha speculum, Strain CCMP1381" /LENGTH=120 /DNA_ID=CAMNT_0028431695 /DNA_START=71 /DNA_END=433 /DNA_ORIENTATION=-